MSASVISFINMKGGVGKTTLCVGIADYLAHYLHKSVLVIDIDPQFNASQSFLGKYNKIDDYLNDLKPSKRTVRRVFDLPTSLMASAGSNNLVSSDIIISMSDNLDIILGDLDIIFDQNNEARRVYKLRDFIDDNKIKDKYDFILIDSPPTISLFTDSALLASDYYITPAKIDYYSTIGAANLIGVVNNLKQDYKHDIINLGFIYTSIINPMTQKTMRMKGQFESALNDDCYIFTAKFSYVQNLMVGHQGNIASSYAKSRDDIKMITHEFIERINCLEDKKHGKS